MPERPTVWHHRWRRSTESGASSAGQHVTSPSLFRCLANCDHEQLRFIEPPLRGENCPCRFSGWHRQLRTITAKPSWCQRWGCVQCAACRRAVGAVLVPREASALQRRCGGAAGRSKKDPQCVKVRRVCGPVTFTTTGAAVCRG